MNLANMTSWQLKDLIKKGEVTSVDIMRSVLATIKQKEPQVQAYITIRSESELLEEAENIDKRRSKGEIIGVLDGLPVAVKDSICTKDLLTTCASKMLSNFIPPYDATVIDRLRKEDGIILGKTNMDEFSMGSSTENSAMKITRNPHNLDYVPGGTSGGAAAAVSANETILALGADTGGSVRQPASFCGCVGMKPTYGRASRFGLISHASSLDQIGVLAKDVKDVATLMQVICGFDPKDSTSLNKKQENYINGLDAEKKYRIGVPHEYFKEGLDPEVRESIQQALDILKKDGHQIVPIHLTSTENAIQSYYIISSSEASSNLSRYSGVLYGYRAKDAQNINELYLKSRSEGFGDEVKRRIILGTFCLSAGYYDAFYLKAQKVRSIIIKEFKEAFKSCDLIAHPVAPTPAFKIGEKTNDPKVMYLVDIYSVVANLVGLPAISLPCGNSSVGLPIGIQLVGWQMADMDVMRGAYQLERLLNNIGKQEQ